MVWHLRTSFVMALLGLMMLMVLVAACAKSEEKAATPKPTPSPAKPAPGATAAPAPTAATAPATPTAAPAPAATPASAAALKRAGLGLPGLVAPGLESVDVSSLHPTPAQAKEKSTAIALRWSADKLPLWSKASYGGDFQMYGWATPNIFNPFKTVYLGRPTMFGLPIRVDMGRCSLQGKTDMSTCEGKRSEVYSGVLVPDVVARWEQPDPLTYIFKLRTNAMWPAIPPMTRADRTVTAEDLAWYFETQKKEGILKDTFVLTNTITAVDRSTLKISLKEPHADFIRMIGSLSMGLVSKECYDEKGCLDTKIISPGPFILKQSVPRQSAIFEKNTEFQIKGAPWVDRLVLNVISDPAAQKAAFITGQIDNHRLFNPSETESMLKQRPGSQAVVMPFTVQGFSGRAQLKGPLADVRVRRAMVQGVDWRVIWEAGFEGMGMAMVNLPYDYLTGTLPPTLDEAGGYFKVDIAAAKQLLADAGYASGFELTIQTQSASGGWNDTLVAIQSYYKKNLGIDVKIQVLDGVSHSANLYAGTWKDLWHSVCWIPACGFSDADNYMLQEVSWSPMNFNKVNDPKIDQFYLRQRSELDPAKRRDILWEYQRYTWTQFYTIPWGGFPVVEMMQPWEMNANSHTYASLGGTNGSAWTHMFDLTKLRK